MTENRRRVWGEGTWDTKQINGVEYIRYRKWIGIRQKKREEACGKSERECLRKMRQKEKEHLEQESVNSAASNPIKNKALLRDAMWNWLITYKRCVLKPKSFDRLVGTYNAHIKNKPLGVTEIRNITPDLIMQHINFEGEMISYSTLKKVYDLLNMFFRLFCILSISLAYASGKEASEEQRTVIGREWYS